MTQLFAAVDATGSIRFADEVPRGSACGCFCPVCASPLVAKQGDQLQWHFAHESLQEHPECAVGAVNLVHRIAVEFLRESGVIQLPPYAQVVHVGHLQEKVSWKAQFLRGGLQWSDKPSRGAPVATGQLDNGIKAQLYVLVEQTQPLFPPVVGDVVAQIVVWFPMPAATDLKKLVYVRQHIQRCANVMWRHQPDVFGLVGKARERLQKQLKDDEDRRSRAAGMKWAAIANRMQSAVMESRPSSSSVPSTNQAAAQRQIADKTYDWAPERKPLTSFIFYRLRDGTAWIVYTRSDATLSIVPRPAFDGWDEYLPPSVAVASPQEVMYRAPALMPVLTFMSGQSSCTRTSSNPDEFEGL